MTGDPSGFGLGYLANAGNRAAARRDAAGVRFTDARLALAKPLIFESFPADLATREAHAGATPSSRG